MPPELCDDIDDYEDLHRSVDGFAVQGLQGHVSKRAMDEHCTSVEASIAAAILNVANRWVDGDEAYKWTMEAIDDAYRPSYRPKGVGTRQRRFTHL